MEFDFKRMFFRHFFATHADFKPEVRCVQLLRLLTICGLFRFSAKGRGV